MKDKIILALDVDSISQAEDLVRRLSSWVGVFKIGSHLFATGEGKKIIDTIHKTGSEVFLDLKFHDIPNTAANAGRVAAKMGIYMFNVHSTGGYSMMKMVANEVGEEAAKMGSRKPLILAITILTSMSATDLKGDLLIDIPINDYIVHLASLSKRAGLDGVVCSPHEIGLVKNICGDDFAIVTPGIRPSWSESKGDQKRVTTPREAITNGATHIVVGRPILKADSPEKAAERIYREVIG